MALAREIAARRAREVRRRADPRAGAGRPLVVSSQDLRTFGALCWVMHTMRPARLLLVAAVTAAAFASAPALAAAAPPANDNYLASLPMALNATSSRRRSSTRPRRRRSPTSSTRTATAQPLGGGDARADGLQGHAVRQDGLVRPRAADQRRRRSSARPRPSPRSSRVYEWNPADSQITRLVDCTRERGGRRPRCSTSTPSSSYTIQVGGAGGAGGPLTLKVDYFPDSDGDGVLRRARQVPDGAGHRALRRLPAGADTSRRASASTTPAPASRSRA